MFFFFFFNRVFLVYVYLIVCMAFIYLLIYSFIGLFPWVLVGRFVFELALMVGFAGWNESSGVE